MEPKIRKPTKRESKPEKPSDAPSPAKGKRVLRPEDVIFHDVDTIGGIIITGAREPKTKAK